MPKLLDTKARLFGLINPIDLVVLLIGFVVVLKLLTVWIPWPVSSQPCQINLDLVVHEVTPYLAQKIRVGQEIRQAGSEYSLGIIQQKRVTPAEVLVKQNGKVIHTRSSRDFDLWLRVGIVRARVVRGAAPSEIYLGKLPLRVGQQLLLHSPTVNLASEVEAIRVVSNGHR